MRPPQNAGEDSVGVRELDDLCRASMRPPQNAGEDPRNRQRRRRRPTSLQ